MLRHDTRYLREDAKRMSCNQLPILLGSFTNANHTDHLQTVWLPTLVMRKPLWTSTLWKYMTNWWGRKYPFVCSSFSYPPQKGSTIHTIAHWGRKQLVPLTEGGDHCALPKTPWKVLLGTFHTQGTWKILPTHPCRSLFTFALADFQSTGEKENSLVFIPYFL